MTKLPSNLEVYPREYYALVFWADERLTEIPNKPIAIPMPNRSRAAKFVLTANRLRRSLNYFAPQAEVTSKINALTFARVEVPALNHPYKSNTPTVWQVVIDRRQQDLSFLSDLEGFADKLRTVEIPEVAASIESDPVCPEEPSDYLHELGIFHGQTEKPKPES